LFIPRYRAPRNANGLSDADASSVGFLDGDFLELFLDQPAETQGEILKGGSDIERVGMSLSQIQRLLETLQSMH
jgi:DNA damage-binding protein 1